MPAGVAAGHPASAAAAHEILSAGGSAADAAIAGTLAACVAESILTGLAGGGFGTYFDAHTGNVTCLDFFCAVPGLDGDRTAGPMVPIEVNFGGVPLPYSIGGASVAVPGVPAGTGEMHRRWGVLPWARICQPAIELAARGVPLPEAQASALQQVYPALVPGSGGDIYRPGGRLLRTGDVLFHPGLANTMQTLAYEGPAAFYTGSIAPRIVELVRDHGGSLGPVDLSAYRVLQLPVANAELGGHTLHARQDLNRLVTTVATLPDELPLLPRTVRAVALADAMRAHGLQRVGDTTNIAAVDREGNACDVTLTLGIGSGVWLPDGGLHLNSMLGEGEGELITDDRAPGGRVSSMMCPMIVTDGGEFVLAAGSAGASRIRTALIHTLVNLLLEKMPLAEAIAAPRFHVVDSLVHAEEGYPVDELDALCAVGYEVNQWDHISHYFGGASGVGVAGAAGDPRRGGVGLSL